MTWHRLEPVDDPSFFTSAPEIHRFPVRLPVGPERVWESLQSDASLAAWMKGLSVHWTVPRPFGVGTTREVVMPLKAVTVREQFFRWDEGAGYSFFVAECNRPLFRRFAEDYVVEADGNGCLFTWTIAIEPNPRFGSVLRFGAPLNRLAFGQLARSARKYFAD